MYGGRYFVASSMTAIILYMALCNLQYYWFCRRLRDYLLPEHEALYLRLTAQKVGELSIFPIVLCRWTLKWGETDPALDAVRRSVLQFGNSARLILAIMLPIPYVMSALGYTHILERIVT